MIFEVNLSIYPHNVASNIFLNEVIITYDSLEKLRGRKIKVKIYVLYNLFKISRILEFIFRSFQKQAYIFSYRIQEKQVITISVSF